MNNWQNNEEGPKCFCGYPTKIIIEDDQPWLFCFFHTPEEGAMWPLPKEKPNDWSTNISKERQSEIMDVGSKEYYNE